MQFLFKLSLFLFFSKSKQMYSIITRKANCKDLNSVHCKS